MKRYAFLKRWIAACLVCFMVISGNIPNFSETTYVEAATKVKINKTSATIVKGQTLQLKISGTKKSVKWSSSNSKVAKVSSKGLVTGKKKGTAKITATVSGKKYTCKFTVEKPSISTKKATVIIGETISLSLDGTTKKVTWSSDNENIVQVSKDGAVTGVSEGTAVIKATVANQNFECQIKVENPSISVQTATIIKGETITLSLNGTTKKVTWSSDNENIAKVSNEGVVSGVAEGTAVIKATVANQNYECKVKVELPSISVQTATVKIGESISLSLNGTTRKVTWSSNNKNIATVSNEGVVTGVSEGTAVITATVANQNYECKVAVEKGEDPYYKKLTEYISTYGKISDSGYRYIYSGGSGVGAMITLKGETLDFAFIGEVSKTAFYTQLTMPSSGGGTADYYFAWAVTKKTTVEGTVKNMVLSDFTSDTKELGFEFVNGLEGDNSSLEECGCTFLRISLLAWNVLLEGKGLDMTMTDLGFTNWSEK